MTDRFCAHISTGTWQIPTGDLGTRSVTTPLRTPSSQGKHWPPTFGWAGLGKIFNLSAAASASSPLAWPKRCWFSYIEYGTGGPASQKHH